jgi:hypothetical protein
MPQAMSNNVTSARKSRVKWGAATALVIGVALHTVPAAAQCEFNLARSKGLKASLVRNFYPCPGTEFHPGELTVTKAGTPSCSPVEPMSDPDGLRTSYQFGPSGSCSVSLSAKLISDCSEIEDANNPGTSLGLPSDPCHVTYVRSKCSGIVTAQGAPIDEEDTGWKLTMVTRASLDDQTGGDMTVIDFPITFDFPAPDDGKISLSSNSAQALSDVFGTSSADLPPCTSMELVSLVLKAPGGTNGLPFAQIGQGTRPKE